MKAVVTIGLLFCASCVATPGLPGGPLQRPALQGGVAFGHVVTPVRFVRRYPSGGEYGGTDTGYPLAALLPQQFTGRLGLVDFSDVAGNVGLLTGGFELRVGAPEGWKPVPFALTYGYQTGQLGLLDRGNRPEREQRFRLEVYPRISTRARDRYNLVSSLGLSFGTRFQTFVSDAPHPAVTDHGSDTSILRNETRLDGALGVEARGEKFSMSVIGTPYWVLAAGKASEICTPNECFLSHYRNDFGVGLYVSISLTKPLFDSKD